MKESVVYQKSFEFAKEIIKTANIIKKNNEVLAKQFLRSGTSIGANIKEGLYAQSKNDFISKFNIALKEAVETEYWIELIISAEILNIDKLLKDNQEIIKILISIVKTSKENCKL